MRSSSTYRSYNTALPKWLLNRPREFVRHCLAKMSNAETIHKDCISPVTKGEFTVQSETNSKTKYSVSFGDTTTMPTCTLHSHI